MREGLDCSPVSLVGITCVHRLFTELNKNIRIVPLIVLLCGAPITIVLPVESSDIERPKSSSIPVVISFPF